VGKRCLFTVTLRSGAIENINRLKFAEAKAKDVEYSVSKVKIVFYGFVIRKNQCFKKGLCERRAME
jgi:hypothetical protein